MKKLLSLFATISVATTATTTVVACGSGETLNIVFIPSKDPVELLNTVKPLAKKLQNEMEKQAELDGTTFNKKIKITTSTSYEAAGESLREGKTDIALLPVGSYMQYWGDEQPDGTHSAAGILLTATRNAVKPEVEFEEFQNDGKFDNTKASAKLSAQESIALSLKYNDEVKELLNEENVSNYKTALQVEDETATYYRSYIYSNESIKDKVYKGVTDTSSDSIKNYKQNVKSVFLDSNTKIGFSKSLTSSAGLLYPFSWLKEVIGLNEVELAKIYKKKLDQGSYDDAVVGLKNNNFDIVVGFSDIRANSQENSLQKEYLKSSYVIGATDAIINDGIMYSRKLIKDQKEIKELRNSFINLISDPENKSIFDVYSHTGYSAPDSAAKEAELDKNIEDSSKNIEEIQKIINNL